MPALTSVALLTASLLLLAGAMKVVDPAMTVGALRALRVPARPGVVRLGAAAEGALGVTALVVGGRLTWGLVAASYAAFAGFVVVALRAGTMVGSCGCFGREDTPPHWSHVALNVALTLAVLAVAIWSPGPALAGLEWDGGLGAVVVGLTALALYLAHATFVELPRTLAAARRVRPSGVGPPVL